MSEITHYEDSNPAATELHFCGMYDVTKFLMSQIEEYSSICVILPIISQASGRRKSARAKDKEEKELKDNVAAASSNLNVPSDMPTEHTAMIHEKYNEFLKQKRQEKEKQQQQQQKDSQKQDYPKPPEGMSPRQLGLKRDGKLSKVELTSQVKFSLPFVAIRGLWKF